MTRLEWVIFAVVMWAAAGLGATWAILARVEGPRQTRIQAAYDRGYADGVAVAGQAGADVIALVAWQDSHRDNPGA